MPYNQLGVRTINGGNVIRVGPDGIHSIARESGKWSSAWYFEHTTLQ